MGHLASKESSLALAFGSNVNYVYEQRRESFIKELQLSKSDKGQKVSKTLLLDILFCLEHLIKNLLYFKTFV